MTLQTHVKAAAAFRMNRKTNAPNGKWVQSKRNSLAKQRYF